MRRFRCVGSVLLVALVTCAQGCGARSPFTVSMKEEVGGAEQAAQKDAGPGNEAGGEKAAAFERKIIYTADLRLQVEGFDEAARQVQDLAKQYEGYVADMTVSGAVGSPRTGRWTVRVPVQHLDEFRRAVLDLGEPQQNSLASRDVTEEYYDLEARLKNYQAERDSLRKLLDEKGADLKSVLEIRKELRELQGEIERLEGRRQLLQNLVSMTTVNVTLYESGAYIPPQAPSFGKSIGETFRASVHALVESGKGLVLFAVALTPWLPVLALFVAGLVFLMRRARARAQAARAAEVTEVAED